jgi:ABC-type sugar transport system ATPase subunit
MRLFTIVQTLKRAGASFIFVSHKIEEILGGLRYDHRSRGEKVVAQGAATEFGRERLIEAMTGRSIEDRRQERRQPEPRPRSSACAGSAARTPNRQRSSITR